MRILILGNSNIFQRKVFPALCKIKNLKLELASKSLIKTNKKIEKTYGSYQKALEETSADLVYISLINSLHYSWAIKSLKHNKNLIIDKPMTLNLNQTKKIMNLASKKKLLISEAIVFNQHKQFIKMFSMLNFKKKMIINTKFHIPKLNKDNFRNFNKFGGGCFQDMSPYTSSMIRIFFKSTKFSSKIKKIKDSKGIIKSFKFEATSKNIFLNSSFSFNNNYKNQIQILNEHKRYFINYAFSPPIDKILQLDVFNELNNRNNKIKFKKQNVFLTYFNLVFSVLKKKKYNFFYKEINNIAKIKEKIS
jgi:predicted dehydrogenase